MRWMTQSSRRSSSVRTPRATAESCSGRESATPLDSTMRESRQNERAPRTESELVSGSLVCEERPKKTAWKQSYAARTSRSPTVPP